MEITPRGGSKVMCVSSLAELDGFIASRWDAIWSTLRLDAVLAEPVDARLYALALIELYHWSSHASRLYEQAAATAEPDDPGHARFCRAQARAEDGHAPLALADLAAMGVTLPPGGPPPPLGATEALVAYADWVTRRRPVQPALAYDYWTETPYPHIGGALTALAAALGLGPEAMRYFALHERLDLEHGQELGAQLSRVCRTPADWARACTVVDTSMRLMGMVLSAVVETFRAVRDGRDRNHGFLGTLARVG